MLALPPTTLGSLAPAAEWSARSSRATILVSRVPFRFMTAQVMTITVIVCPCTACSRQRRARKQSSASELRNQLFALPSSLKPPPLYCRKMPATLRERCRETKKPPAGHASQRAAASTRDHPVARDNPDIVYGTMPVAGARRLRSSADSANDYGVVFGGVDAAAA